ncbi:MAG: aminotransferase class I/II-fold pyridoxal phosphate-dependent enzyme [Bacteroidetes bacterium]|nr:aminotransferase class I/II-fold pyridoxal phosphate-dependent enzyme [Bacteroidota bacterium]
MIDLRSDTFTTPDEGMREAMARAPVGDDVYGEDPSLNALQDRMAALFGMEAALFVPSGTMGNQISIALHASTGDEVIADADAHIFHYENAATSVIARSQIHGVRSETGAMAIDDVRAAIRPTAYYYPRTALIAVENSHNRHGGTVIPLDHLAQLRALANEHGIPLHCDGARVWNACAALQCTPQQAAQYFDTISVCMSKGAGAPVGSLILSTRARIEQARRWRKMLGGGMRQAGILAAAAFYALDHVVPKIPMDHERARNFAERLGKVEGIMVDLTRVQTNLVAFQVPGVDDATMVSACAARGLLIAPIRSGTLRCVFYHQITDAMANEAADIISHVVAELRNATFAS